MGKCRYAQLSAAFILTFGFVGTVQAQCAPDTVSVRGDFGSAQFTVEVADDNAERGRGLMFVEQMASMEGMLFVYERPQSVSFWMRNTLIPLDMIFVNASGEIQNIHENAIPLDETSIYGGEEIQFVLEINGGMAGRLGLEAGNQMQHPAFGDAGIWPCS